MSHNYLEKLIFTLSLLNLTKDDQTNPVLYIGINDVDREREFHIPSGLSEISTEQVVLNRGEQKLVLEVKETDNAWRTGAFKIEDLRIHGMSVGMNLFNSFYFPKYDQEYFEKNKSHLLLKEKGGIHLGNRGRWEWNFEAPIRNNALYKIGMW
jgi:hypothetical protein